MQFRGCIYAALLVLGLLLILGGVGLKWGLFPVVVEQMIVEQIRLSPDNDEIWDTWVEPSKELPVYMNFNFFNVTNPQEIKNNQQPKVQEVGPFAFREERKKVGISQIGDTITYGSHISYHFDEAASCPTCKADTQITVINPALLGIIAMVSTLEAELGTDLQESILGPLNQLISDPDGQFAEYYDDLFTTQTPSTLLYDGYEPGSIKAILYILEALAVPIPIPDIIADGKFAFFKDKNGTSDLGWYKINTGLYNTNLYQHIEEFNGQPRLPEGWWDSLPKTPSANRSGVEGYCHDLAGTDGTQYPPFVNKDNNLWMFSSDLCRSIYLSYYEDVDMDGVETYQFRVKPDVLSFANPDNACFCPNVGECAKEDPNEDKWDLSACTHCRDGMISLYGCQGAPVIISLPHFLDASEADRTAVEGIHPDPALHTTYLNIEPLTGLALDAHKRIQVNVPLQSNDWITVLNNVKEAIFPVVWVDEFATVQGDSMDKVKDNLVKPFRAVDIGVGFMIGVGILLLLGVSILSVFFSGGNPRRKKSQKA